MSPNTIFIPEAMVINEQTIRFDFGPTPNQETYRLIQQFCHLIKSDGGHLLEEVMPSTNTVTVFYMKELVNPYEVIEGILVRWKCNTETGVIVAPRSIGIPVCYDPVFSEDMQRISEHTGLTREEIITIHTGTTYNVYMIGFLPGFPYLGELPESLHVPRLEKPRLRVPKGTVGIGGTQTGIYPIESPGGWNCMGRTPLDLYSLNRVEPFLIHTGDQLQFRSVSLESFHEIKEELAREPERIKQFVKEELS